MNLDEQAIQVVALMVRAKVLTKDQEHRAEALLRESFHERFGPLLKKEGSSEDDDEEEHCTGDCGVHCSRHVVGIA